MVTFSGFSGSSGGPSVFPCDLRQHMLAPVLAVPGRPIFGPVGGFFWMLIVVVVYRAGEWAFDLLGSEDDGGSGHSGGHEVFF